VLLLFKPNVSFWQCRTFVNLVTVVVVVAAAAAADFRNELHPRIDSS
jgi:hypothetical protein